MSVAELPSRVYAARPMIGLGSLWQTIPLWLLLGAMLVLVGLPIVMVALLGFDVAPPGLGFRFGLDNWQQAWSDPQLAPALVNTAKIVTTRTVIAFVVSIVLSWLLARTNLPGSNWLEFGFWLSFF